MNWSLALAGNAEKGLGASEYVRAPRGPWVRIWLVAIAAFPDPFLNSVRGLTCAPRICHDGSVPVRPPLAEAVSLANSDSLALCHQI